MMYGPQTAEITNLIDRLASLTPEQVKALGDWDGCGHDYALVLYALRDATRKANRANTWYDTWSDVRIAGEGVIWGNTWGTIRDATLALFVRDLISEFEFNTLYDSWANVMEEKS